MLFIQQFKVESSKEKITQNQVKIFSEPWKGQTLKRKAISLLPLRRKQKISGRQ